jgi:hypothetical protein
MTQPDLLDHAARHHEMADTSLEQWDRIRKTLPERQHAVFELVWAYCLRSGFTDCTSGELALATGRSVLSLRPRIHELVKAGVLDSLEPRASRAAGEAKSHPVRPAIPLAAIERAAKTSKKAA